MAKRLFAARNWLSRLFSGALFRGVASGQSTPDLADRSVRIHIPESLTQTYRRPMRAALWQGWLPNGNTPTVTKNGTAIASQCHVRSQWPDGSAKHVHIYAAWDAYDEDDIYLLWNGAVGSAASPPTVQSNITITPFLTDYLGNDYESIDETTETLDDGTIARVVHKSGTMAATGAGDFTPDVIDSLTCWLKADSLVLNNNDPVSAWTDSSGSSHGATASGTARPTYQTNAIGGLPALLFDGSTDVMQVTNLGTALSGDDTYTIFFLIKNAGSLANRPYLLSYPLSPVQANADFSFELRNAHTGGMMFRQMANNWEFFDLGLNAAPTATVMIGATKTNATTGVVHKFGVDAGIAVETNLSGITATFEMTGDMYLGAGLESSSLRRFNGHIAEVIVFTTALSDSDRQRVEGYLAHKYGLTGSLTADHPYKVSEPTNEPTPFLTYDTWATYYSDRIDVEHEFTILPEFLPNAELRVNNSPPAGWNTWLWNEANQAPFARSGSDIILWPSGGTAAVVVGEANVHKRPWEHSGEFLQLSPPSDAQSYFGVYATAYPTEGEGTPGVNRLVGHGLDYDPRGRLFKVKYSFEHSSYSIAARRTMLDNGPVPSISADDNCASGAFGPCAPRSTQYADFETAVEQVYLDFNDQTKAGQEHSHWNDWGQAAERILTVGAVTRPHIKRCCSTGHYPQHGLWLSVIRGADQEILDRARQVTHYTRAFIQCNYAGDHQYKRLWGFSHGKAAIFPDGTSGPNAATGDTDFNLTGHWPDPYLLLLSWLHDCSWSSKKGFDNWLATVDFSEDQFGREAVETLGQATYAYRYAGDDFPSARLIELQAAATTLITKSISDQLDDPDDIAPMSNPIWPTQALEVLDNAAARQYILDNAAEIAVIGDPYTPYQLEGSSTVALMAHARYLSGAASLLDDVIPPFEPVPNPEPTLQIGPGALGELHQAIAWPVALFYLLLSANEVEFTFPMECRLSATCPMEVVASQMINCEVTTEVTVPLTV